MFLSRLSLTGEQFRNAYEIHRTLWSVFPESPDQVRDFLFRIEQRSSRHVKILMQSERQPGIETVTIQIEASKSVNLNLSAETQLRFLLVANPVKTIADEQGRLDSNGAIKKCRVPLINEEAQVVWLKRKLNGAALVSSVDIEKQLPMNFRRRGRPGKIQPYAFKGVLQVRNPSIFMSLLEQGIGPAKAFGCGMLSVAAV
jgi:CRISPR system Cascade subunit CasE